MFIYIYIYQAQLYISFLYKNKTNVRKCRMCVEEDLDVIQK